MAKILVVDDSIAMRMQLVDMLTDGGHEVVETGDGYSALKIIEEVKDLQLLIVDFHMPGMNGVELSEIVRAHEVYGKVPIFMLTTESFDHIIENGRRIGVTAWLIKPLNSERLLKAIDRVV